jgi:hypothetical protein
VINHGALTDALITQLVTDTGELVGDGVAPTAGGWLAGQPNQSVYVPYIVLASQGASVMINDLDGNLDWTVTWSMRYFAGSRKQVDWIANKARNAIDGGPNNVLYKTFGTTPQYKITAVQWTNLGAVQRVDTVNPPYWQVFDSFGLVCSRTSFTPTM